MDERQKKNRHLIVQMGMTCIVLFGVALIANAISIIYNQSRQGIYLVNRSCENVAKEVVNELKEYRALPWLLDYWEEHAGEDMVIHSKGIDPDIDQRYHQMLANKHNQIKAISVSEAKSMNPEFQVLFASDCYKELADDMAEVENTLPHVNILCSRKTADDRYILFLSGESENDEFAAGKYRPMTFFERSPGPVADFYYGNTNDVHRKDLPQYDVLPVTENPQEGILRYTVVYKPVKLEGKMVAVVSIEMGWTEKEWRQALNMIGRVEIMNALCLIVAAAALLGLQWYFTIRPISDLQKRVREYTRDKDVNNITKNISKIRSLNEIGRLADDVSSMAVEMEDYSRELLSVTAEKERLGAELNVAAGIQLGVLPKTFPAFPDRDEFDIYATMTPAKTVGGDLYDFFLIDPDHLGLVIGDVSGKGVPASLFMMITKTLIQHEMEKGEYLAKVLYDVNNRLCKGNEEMMFVTIWVGILEISSGRLVSGNGGHDYPMVRKAGGGFELCVNDNDPALGIMDNGTYQINEMLLKPGDTLLVYTDGFPEAMNKQGEAFGDERMLLALNEDPGASPQELCERLQLRVDEFVQEAEQFDDMTMLCVKLM